MPYAVTGTRLAHFPGMTNAAPAAAAPASTDTPEVALMKTLKFGVEIETVGLTRDKLAAAIASAIPGATVDPYYAGRVKTADGRLWNAVRDGSLNPNYGECAGEVVTPILTWVDLPILQDVIRALRRAGAKVDTSCGIHVHVGALDAGYDAKALVRLAKLTYQQEDLIVKALGVTERRLGHYTKKCDEDFIRKIERARITSLDTVKRLWFGRTVHGRPDHYDSTRYRGLNLHSIFYRGTVEFRYFEATLHAGEVKSYVQFCLAMVAKAKLSKASLARKRAFNAATAKYDFRVFLLRLGMIGDDFKTARHHLLGRMAGSASWKHGRPISPTTGREMPSDPPATLPSATEA